MGIFKCRGIVLKETSVLESDKIVTLFLKEYGKISAMAKAGRKTSGKLLATTQLFAYSDFVINKKGNLYFISQADLIENFSNITKDYDKLCVSSYLLELCDKVVLEDVCCDDILLLLLKSLKALSTISPQLVCSVFEFKFMEYNGYLPQMDCCFVCGEFFLEYFHFAAYGVLCENCAKNYKKSIITISKATLCAINYILSISKDELKNLFCFTLSDNAQQNLTKAANIFMYRHLDVKINSKKFLPWF